MTSQNWLEKFSGAKVQAWCEPPQCIGYAGPCLLPRDRALTPVLLLVGLVNHLADNPTKRLFQPIGVPVRSTYAYIS